MNTRENGLVDESTISALTTEALIVLGLSAAIGVASAIIGVSEDFRSDDAGLSMLRGM